MSALWNYYGIDWALLIFSIINLWLLGNGKKIGFLVGITANICGIIFGIMIESYASPPMNIMFIIMNVRGYLRWRERENEVQCIDRIKKV